MGLSDSERISMIRSAVLIQYTRDRQTDGRTDRRTDGIGVAYTRYSMLSRVKKEKARTALNGTPMTELRNATCHSTQVNAPRHNPSLQAGTRFTYSGGMDWKAKLI